MMQVMYIEIPHGYVFGIGTEGIDHLVNPETGDRIAINGELGILNQQKSTPSHPSTKSFDASFCQAQRSMDTNMLDSANNLSFKSTLIVLLTICTIVTLQHKNKSSKQLDKTKTSQQPEIPVYTHCPNKDCNYLEYLRNSNTAEPWHKVVNGKQKHNTNQQRQDSSFLASLHPGKLRESLTTKYYNRRLERMQSGMKAPGSQ